MISVLFMGNLIRKINSTIAIIAFGSEIERNSDWPIQLMKKTTSTVSHGL